MSESKLRRDQAVDAEARRLQGERSFAEGEQLLRELDRYCRRHKSAMATMNVDEQSVYLLKVFDSAHIVYAVWKKPGGRGRDRTLVKGSIELLQDSEFGGGNTCLVDAVEVDDFVHAMLMKMAYTLQHGEPEGWDTADFAWDIVTPGMQVERQKTMAAFERDLSDG